MNAPKAIELAMLEVLKTCAELGLVEVRAWQTLPQSVGMGSDYTRKFPCVDIRCTPQAVDENGETLACAINILCATQVDSDRNHAIVSDLYEKVQAECDKLYVQSKNQTAGTTENEIGVFDASLSANEPTITRGGFTFSDGLGPQDEDGLNIIGVSLVCHFSRSDW